MSLLWFSLSHVIRPVHKENQRCDRIVPLLLHRIWTNLCTVRVTWRVCSTSPTAPLFTPLMFAEFHNQSPLLCWKLSRNSINAVSRRSSSAGKTEELTSAYYKPESKTTSIEASIIENQLRCSTNTWSTSSELVEGKRSRGGKKKRFKGVLQTNLKKCDADVTCWEETARDWTLWRTTIRKGTAIFEEDVKSWIMEQKRRRGNKHQQQPQTVLPLAVCRPKCWPSLSGKNWTHKPSADTPLINPRRPSPQLGVTPSDSHDDYDFLSLGIGELTFGGKCPFTLFLRFSNQVTAQSFLPEHMEAVCVYIWMSLNPQALGSSFVHSCPGVVCIQSFNSFQGGAFLY